MNWRRAKPRRPPERVPPEMEHGDHAGADRASGSRPADFDETFTRSFGPMVRSLALACGDREVAADCVQEAFTKAFARWGRVSRFDDPPGWVRHVALNKIRDHYRKVERGRRAVARLEADAATVDTSAAEPESHDLGALLAGLPAQQRTAAALFYVESLSVADVAHAMGLSEGAVKYHLHAARASLRSAMETQS